MQASHSKLDDEPVPAAGRCGFNRSIATFQLFVVILLPAIRTKTLTEISLGICETGTDQWNSKVRRFFTVIACKYSEAARINRQGSVESELRREVANRLSGKFWKLFL